MLRGLYASASGMLADTARLDVVANNLANATTTGYKRDTALTESFQDLLVERLGADGAPRPVGRLGLGTFVAATRARLAGGALRYTGGPLDLAISGDGLLTLQTPAGRRYTRAGALQQDAAGRLVNPDGYPVLVAGQEVSGRHLSITDQGHVLADGQDMGPLHIVSSQEAGPLEKAGGGLWAPAAGAGSLEAPAVPQPWRVRVGFLESSNVEPVLEMVAMIAVQRSYEANQRAIQAQDETLAKAVGEVARA